MKWVFAASGLLCILWSGLPGGALADQEGKPVVVFSASSRAETGGEAVWRLILDYVAEKEGWAFAYRGGGLQEGVKQLNTGEADLLTAVPKQHPDIQSGLIAQEAVMSTWATILTHMGLSVDSLLDLRNLRVGVVQGDFNNPDARGVLKDLDIGLMLVEFKSGEELLKALENRWIDAAVVDRFYATAKVREYRVVQTAIIFSPMDYRFAVSQDAGRSMLSVLDYHVRLLKKDPVSIYNRYLESLSGEKKDLRLLRYFKYGLWAAMASLFGVTFHALILRHRVKRRTFELTQSNSSLKDALAKREKAEASIKASEEKYRRLVENAHDLIIVSQKGVLQFANPAAAAVFGYHNAEAVPFAGLVHPEDRGALAQLDAIERDSATQLSYHTFRALTKGGKVRWLQMNAVQIDWNKKPAALCIIRDITEAKHLENQLAQAQKMQAIGTLAGGIAHDFNNILAAILGYTELCKLKVPPEKGLRRNLDQILIAGERAKELVKQILTFSHHCEDIRQPMEIKYSIKETLKLLKATIPSNIQIKLHIQPASAIVLADPTQIQRILMNLCTNAAHAMQESGGILEINLRTVEFDRTSSGIHKDLEPGPYVALTVSDTGQGMTAETLQRIFEPYFTTKKQGEGTGLGLSVVHGIIRKLNGVIKAYSELGAGTTFNVYIPRVQASPAPELPAAVEGTCGGGELILLVDDEAMVLDMTSEMLRSLGYRVVPESGSDTALKTFRTRPDRFDLVITDQTMPHMTGKSLAQEMLRIRPDLPIILCTGFSASINEEQALAMGIRGFVRKPVLCTELAAIVRQALCRGETHLLGAV